MTDLLRSSLREFAAALQPAGITLMIVGGYGLVLRTEAVARTGERTLGGPAQWTRSTEDIDCFLGHSIITDAAKTERIRLVLEQLGYRAVTEHFLFERSVQTPTLRLVIRVDLMAPPVSDQELELVVSKGSRIRPVGYDKLHGRLTPEAVFADESPMTIDISADGSALMVHLPHAYPYLILKLFALRDGPTSKAPDRASRHALDMYMIWSTITEAELASSIMMRDKFAGHPIIVEAQSITSQLFAGPDAPAILSLRVDTLKSGVALEMASILEFQRDMRMMFRATSPQPFAADATPSGMS